MPDPTEFIAGTDAFQELCFKRYPEMKNDITGIVASMSAEERAYVIQIRQTPKFVPTLQNARIAVKKFTPEKI